ncbi:hypothetical protein AB4Z48_18525 [Cupriavidus sp. 2TAF22]|uniref:hypothetical protein n=1 Tax=unclassified Cupriavidus TaxID=2640874 RepID=UPI003F8E58EF
MKNSIHCSWSIESPTITRWESEKEFEVAARAARNELKLAHARADADLFHALRNTASMDLRAISNTQANFARALAMASENYHKALANAERLRLYATSITDTPIGSGAPQEAQDPFLDVVMGLAMQLAAELTFSLLRVSGRNRHSECL